MIDKPETAPSDGPAQQEAPASKQATGPGGPRATDAPPDNEFKGRGEKKKKLGKSGKPQRPAKTQVEEQIDEALAQSSIHVKRKQQKKLQKRLAILGGVIVLVSYGVYWAFKPYQGGMAFGVCRVFLEGTLRYPDMLRISTVEEFDTSVRIWYTQVDSFGEYRMEPIQCYYKQDPERGTLVEKVLINRREVDPKIVENFNRALPAITAYPPDLTIPYPLPDSLQDLQIQTDKFRKPIL